MKMCKQTFAWAYWGGLFFCLTLFFSGAAFASPQAPSEEKPTVALVLGGGGARGAAHIGVVRILEELQVPVDIVVGTSMGAIIAGLYAAGMNPDELDDLANINWDQAFRDKPPREQLPYRKKKEEDRYIGSMGLGIKNGGVMLPKGLMQGQSQIQIFQRLIEGRDIPYDFDDLPLRYRSVTTNIETNQAVVLGEGNLAQAIRASMTVPGFFAPVEIDGMLLVDGGLVNNIPVNVARDMGADVIIVVDVGSPYAQREDLVSVLDITDQLVSFMVRGNSDRELETLEPVASEFTSKNAYRITQGDILIRPELGNLSSADFENAHQAIIQGQIAALKKSELLKQLSVSDEVWAQFLKRQRQAKKESPDIVKIEINNISDLSEDVIRAHLNIPIGEPLNRTQLEADLEDLYALDYFERIEYVLKTVDGGAVLSIDLVEKSWGPHYLRFSFNMHDDFQGNGTFSMGVNYRLAPVNKRGGEFQTELRFGERFSLMTEFYQPIDLGLNYFISPFVGIKNWKINEFQGGNATATFKVIESAVGVHIGRNMAEWGVIRLGIQHIRTDEDLSVGSSELKYGALDRNAFYGGIGFDTQNDSFFPTTGGRGFVRGAWAPEEMDNEAETTRMSMKGDWAMTWGQLTLRPGVIFNTNFESETTVSDLYPMGGLFELSGFAPDELSGAHAGLARIVWYHKISVLKGMPFYLGGSFEGGNVWNEWEDITLNNITACGSLMVAVETFLGPAAIGLGVSEAGRSSGYFMLGRRF